MKNSDYILFLDMDGVLVDYNEGWWTVAKRLNIKPLGDQSFNKDDLRHIGRQVSNSSFWSSLGWEYGGEALWKASNELFENVHILSSTAAKADNDYHKIVVQGKMEWIADHLDGLHPTNIHIVTEGVLKAKFAAKNAILVDDRKSTTEAFKPVDLVSSTTRNIIKRPLTIW